jgi:hypothetical protein
MAVLARLLPGGAKFWSCKLPGSSEMLRMIHEEFIASGFTLLASIYLSSGIESRPAVPRAAVGESRLLCI